MLNTQLKIALMVSLFWHLVILCTFSLVFSSTDFRFNLQSDVMFLGSILQSSLIDDAATIALPEGSELSNESRFNERAFIKHASEKGRIDAERFIDVDFTAHEYAQSFAALENGASLREIIFKPNFLGYPEWEQEEIVPGAVEFKIFISSEGIVEQVLATRVSGNPEIDAAFSRYIRRWRFAPAAETNGEWQRVTLSLNFESISPLSITFKKAEG